MRFPRSAVMTAVFLAFSCAPGIVMAEDPTPPPKPLIEQRGLPMSAQEAMERITFHPFVPAPNYSQVGLMPAFHGDDKDHPENRGIGYEYTSGGQTYLLREWPLAGGSLDRYPAMKPEGTCKTGRSALGPPENSRSIAWTTSTLAFALQPDTFGGSTNVPALHREWTRLIKRGACR
jgi:hypothetical protein